MVAPPLPHPSGFSNPFQRQQTQIQRRQTLLPSIHFCDTGELAPGEIYNPEIHNVGVTPQERCSRFYPQYRGGKSRNKRRKLRKSKSRKNRRKTKMRH